MSTRLGVAFALALAACAHGDAIEEVSAPTAPEPELAPQPVPVPTPAPATATKSAPWTFAVLSDLHLPNPNRKKVDQVVAALVAMKVRFVVVTGDHTNGGQFDFRRNLSREWWAAVTGALRPLRDAGIGVFPVAGNHDQYQPWQRDGYAEAFADLDAWAGPLHINRGGDDGKALARAPFSYSVDVDGVHLTLAHVVYTKLHPEVASWLEQDLAGAKSARHRLVFGHVPLSSVILKPETKFLNQLGSLLEHHKVAFYVAGHEHVVWDENVALPAGGSLRQVLVGCSSGFYNYEPAPHSKKSAGCAPVKAGTYMPQRCTMPNDGGLFMLVKGRPARKHPNKLRLIEHHTIAYTLFTVDGDDIRVKPMSIDADGHAVAFYHQ